MAKSTDKAATIKKLITDVKLFRRDWKKVPASGYIILANCIKISGVKIVEYDGGHFVSLPREQSKKEPEKYFDIAMPCDAEGKLDKEVSAAINEVVLEYFEKLGPAEDDDIPF